MIEAMDYKILGIILVGLLVLVLIDALTGGPK